MNGHLSTFLLVSMIAVAGCSDATPGSSKPDAIVDTGQLPVTDVDASPGDTNRIVEDTQDSTQPEDTKDTFEPDAPATDSGDTANADTAPMPDTAQPDTSDTSDATDDADAPSDATPDVADAPGPPPFNQSVPVSGNSDYQTGVLHGMVVTETGQVFVFWRGTKADDTTDLLISHSTPSVDSFLSPTIIKSGLPSLGPSADGDILFTPAATFHLVWRSEDANGKGTIVYRKTDAADFTGTETALDTSNQALWRPYLVQDKSNLCALWQKGKTVQMACSLDAGDTWTLSGQVNPPGTSATVSAATFANSGVLVVAFQAGGLNKNGVYIRTTDLTLWTNGDTPWSNATQVNGVDIDNGNVSDSVAADGNHLKPTMLKTMTGNLKLAWHQDLPGLAGEAYLTTSTDGHEWETPSVLPDVQTHVSLVTGRGSDLHLSGVDGELGYGPTVYLSSPDEGVTWGSANPIPVTPDALLLTHHMRSNLVEGWLHIGWWETLPNNLVKQTLKLVTVDP